MGIRARKGQNGRPCQAGGLQNSSAPRTDSVLDFSVPGSLPWDLLVERIREIEADATSKEDLAAAASVVPSQQDPTVKQILSYLNQRGYQMVSYDRIRRRIDPALTDKDLDALVDSNSTVFRHAILKDD